MTASAADLATVQQILDDAGSLDLATRVKARKAIHALLARCQKAERDRDDADLSAQLSRDATAIWKARAETAEAERDEAFSHEDGLMRERDNANDLRRIAEARVAELEQALKPFASGAEAFDNADGTYGEGPVFERISGGTKEAHWAFTIADVRRARAAQSGGTAEPKSGAEWLARGGKPTTYPLGGSEGGTDE